MGATDFMVRRRGSSAEEAFREAVEDAKHEHGHGGYTGTIAEKSTIVHVSVGRPPEDLSPEEQVRWYMDQADRLMTAEDLRIADKWGPAGCVTIAEGDYLFFGWASE